ncbi:MAG: hypothetical protein ABSD51_06755 [Candidatus Binatus sp.]|jgi:hypothetical protein
MTADKKQSEAIRLSMLIQGVGAGRDVPDQEVVDSFEKMEGKTSALSKWASNAVSFFLPSVTPSSSRSKSATQSEESRSDLPVERGKA